MYKIKVKILINPITIDKVLDCLSNEYTCMFILEFEYIDILTCSELLKFYSKYLKLLYKLTNLTISVRVIGSL